MASFLTHLIIGVLVVAIAVFFFHGNPTVDQMLLFLLGSVIPDIDHPLAIIRRVMFAALFIGGVAAIIFFCYSYGCSALEFFGALFMFLLLFVILEKIIPGHRGVIHGLIGTILFGLTLFIITKSVSLASFGFGGYLLHIAIDFLSPDFQKK